MFIMNIHTISFIAILLSIIFYILRSINQQYLISIIVIILILLSIMIIYTNTTVENKRSHSSSPSSPSSPSSSPSSLSSSYFNYIRKYDEDRYHTINQSIDDIIRLKTKILTMKDEHTQKRLFTIFLDKQNTLMDIIYSIQNILPPKLLKKYNKDTFYIHEMSVDMIKSLAIVLKKRGYHMPEYGVMGNNFVT